MRRGSSGIRSEDQAGTAALEARLAALTATVERQRRLLETLPAAADVAVVTVDEAGRCQVLGERHRELLAEAFVEDADGCREAVGAVFDADGVRALTHDELPSVRAGRGEVVDHLQVWIGADAETRRPFTVSARAVRGDDGAVRGAVLAYRDVDELFRVQELHDEFLRSMSHELRTPLASVLGRLELLAERDDLPADVARLVFGAHRNAGRLSHLVADMLEVVEVRDGELSLHAAPADVADIVRSAVHAAAAAAQAVGVSIAYEGSERVAASVDGDRLRQSLDHLIGNAVKFTDPGGAVTVRLARQRGEIVLEVADTGVGLDPGETDLVFGRFSRGRAAHDRAAAGMGIGLWVVRNVAEAHGGHVVAERVDPHGTVFRLVLPDQSPRGSAVDAGGRAAGRCWSHSPDAAWVDRGDRVMALDLDRPGARPQALEGVAAVIWRLLDVPRTVDELVQVLAAHFDGAGQDQMRGDVEQFLADLTVAGLTRVLDA